MSTIASTIDPMSTSMQCPMVELGVHCEHQPPTSHRMHDTNYPAAYLSEKPPGRDALQPECHVGQYGVVVEPEPVCASRCCPYREGSLPRPTVYTHSIRTCFVTAETLWRCRYVRHGHALQCRGRQSVLRIEAARQHFTRDQPRGLQRVPCRWDSDCIMENSNLLFS